MNIVNILLHNSNRKIKINFNGGDFSSDLALVSAVAYTLWSVLLAYNDVSKVAIFGFVNPLCSVILSALVLGEVKQAFNIGSLIALALVCVGIYIVNAKKNNKSNVE